MSHDPTKPPEIPETIIIDIDDDIVMDIGTEFQLVMSPKTSKASEEVEARLRAMPPGTPFSKLLKIIGLDMKENLVGMDWSGVRFENDGDLLEGANFRHARMHNTHWAESTSVRAMNFQAADLTNATGLTEERMATAYIDERTILPESMDRARIMELHRAMNMPPPPAEEPGEGKVTFHLVATAQLDFKS